VTVYHQGHIQNRYSWRLESFEIVSAPRTRPVSLSIIIERATVMIVKSVLT
jgi:hypothetical protein